MFEVDLWRMYDRSCGDQRGRCEYVSRPSTSIRRTSGAAAAAVCRALERAFSAPPGPSYWALHRTSPRTGARSARPMGRPRCRNWAAAGGAGRCAGPPAVTPARRPSKWPPRAVNVSTLHCNSLGSPRTGTCVWWMVRSASCVPRMNARLNRTA